MTTHILQGLVGPAEGREPLDDLPPLLPGQDVVQRPGVDRPIPREGHLVVVQLVQPANVQLKYKSRIDGSKGLGLKSLSCL